MPESGFHRDGVTCLTGGSVVLPDGVRDATVVIDAGRIVEICSGPRAVGGSDERVDVSGHLVLPGFIDVHCHGALGTDVLDGSGAVRTVARALPRWGVTAFCPTSVACHPAALRSLLAEVGRLRQDPEPTAARVLGAHLESNFLNPEFAGAQPVACLRVVSDQLLPGLDDGPQTAFSGLDVLSVIESYQADIGIVTMAPEIVGGRELLQRLVRSGLRVSIGHTAADYEQASMAFADGARHVTHLFNRMTGLAARDPGLVGAALAAGDVAVELIGDGCHVHPAALRVAVAAKGADKVMAITDATAGAGLPRGSTARLGGRDITVADVARLADGTMAGSVVTMDRVFANLVVAGGLDIADAARICASTPARELGLIGRGAIAEGAVADLVVLSRTFEVVQTWIGGLQSWDISSADPGPEAAA